MAGQAGSQCALDVVDLADPVQLVPGQVQQHDDRRVHRVGDVRDVHLVHFQGGQPGVPVGGQGGHQTRVHIGALAVRRD